MKWVKKEQKIWFILISVFVMSFIPLIFCTLFLKKFNTDEFYEKEEVEYLSDFAYKKYEVCYGNIFSCKEAEVTIKGNVDTSKLGEYEIKYTYSYNGKSLEKTHMVKVVDKDAPMITIKDENFCYCENNRIPPYEVKAIDNYDGDISDKVKSFLKEGKIVFEVEDSSGNKTTLEKNAEKKDNNAPEITLNGNATIFLKLNEEYEEYGAKATDFCDGDLTEKIKIEGSVNTKKEGKYILTYHVTDESGNHSSITRTIVIEDTKNAVAISKQIYLTFDDGPSMYTEQLLDVLKKYQAKATFFVTNQNLTKGYDDVIARAYKEGHTIGLHSYTHDYAIYSSVDAYLNDLYAIQEKVKRITGHTSYIIRFPGGSSNTISKNYDNGTRIMSQLTKIVKEKGFRYYDWNILSGDAGQTQNTIEITKNVIKEFGKFYTPVVLQHDIKEYSVNAVEKILEYGTSHGYTFSSITMDTPEVHHHVNN